jgi:hypothetical protein
MSTSFIETSPSLRREDQIALQATLPPRPPRLFVDVLLSICDRWGNVCLIALAALYAATFNGQWRIEPDSALYLSLARNLARGRGYVYHGMPQTLAYPGLPVLVAGTFRIFGVHTLWPANLMMLGFAAAALALTYRLFLLHADRPMAVFMTISVGCTKLFMRYAIALMTDMPFLAGVMAVLVAMLGMLPRRGETTVRPIRWYDVTMLISGLALTVSMRPAMLSFLPVVLIVGVSRAIGRKRYGAAIFVTLIMALAVTVFVCVDPRRFVGHEMGDYEGFVLSQVADRPWQAIQAIWDANAPELFQNTVVQAVFGQRMPAPMGLIFGVAIVLMGLALYRQRPLWGLWIASTIAMMLLVLPHDRYLLAVLPLLVYAWSYGIICLNRRLGPRWGSILAAMLWFTGAGMNISQVAGMIVEQRQLPFLAHYKHGDYVPLLAMAEQMHERLPRGAWILSPFKTSRILSFYSDHWAVEPNEMPFDHEGRITIDPTREPIYVLIDPTSSDSLDWQRSMLQTWHMHLDRADGTVAWVPRTDGSPPLKLWRATLDAAR